MRDPFKISTYTFNKVDEIQHSPYYTTNYDGSVLRDKLLMAGVSKSELSTLRWIYKTICWENKHGEKEWIWTDFEEKYKGTYVNLIETISSRQGLTAVHPSRTHLVHARLRGLGRHADVARLTIPQVCGAGNHLAQPLLMPGVPVRRVSWDQFHVPLAESGYFRKRSCWGKAHSFGTPWPHRDLWALDHLPFSHRSEYRLMLHPLTLRSSAWLWFSRIPMDQAGPKIPCQGSSDSCPQRPQNRPNVW